MLVLDMNNWNKALIMIMLLSASVLVTQSVLAEDESIGNANQSLSSLPNITELITFVESAVAYAQENGKDMALMEFNNKTGAFVDGELYIYAFDFNGTCIAHPFESDWIGENKFNETDSNGILATSAPKHKL
jgi:signal transduction histidine kinase